MKRTPLLEPQLSLELPFPRKRVPQDDDDTEQVRLRDPTKVATGLAAAILKLGDAARNALKKAADKELERIHAGPGEASIKGPGSKELADDLKAYNFVVDYAAFFSSDLTRWFNIGEDGDPVRAGVYQTCGAVKADGTPHGQTLYRKYFGGHEWSKAMPSALAAAEVRGATKLFSGPMYYRGVNRDMSS